MTTTRTKPPGRALRRLSITLYVLLGAGLVLSVIGAFTRGAILKAPSREEVAT